MKKFTLLSLAALVLSAAILPAYAGDTLTAGTAAPMRQALPLSPYRADTECACNRRPSVRLISVLRRLCAAAGLKNHPTKSAGGSSL